MGTSMLAKVVGLCLFLTATSLSWSIEPVTGSTLKHYSKLKQSDHWLVLGAVERINGVMTPEAQVRVPATVFSWIWQLPLGHTTDDAFDSMKKQVSQQAVTLYECAGRTCGLSNDIANQVFSQPILYGRDGDQRYWIALESEQSDVVWLVYSSSRASKQIYVYVEKIQIDKKYLDQLFPFVQKGKQVELYKNGYIVLQSLTSESVKLSDQQIEWLKELLLTRGNDKFALVVHRYGKVEDARLLDQTQSEAQGILDQLAKADGFIQHVYARGVGALAPRVNHKDRIELVLLKQSK